MMPVAEPALLVTVNASPSVTDSAPLATAIDIPVASPPAAFTVTAAPLPVSALAAVVLVTSVPYCVVIPVALAPVLVTGSAAPAKSTDQALGGADERKGVVAGNGGAVRVEDGGQRV